VLSVSNMTNELTGGTANHSPFTLFGIIHATRIAFAYRKGIKALGFNNQIGCESSFSSICRTLGSSSTEPVSSSETTALQAAAFPVILIFSGGTIISSLLGSVPGWLISPLAIANYAYVIHFAWSTWRGRIHSI
jgi:hypothetical protein